MKKIILTIGLMVSVPLSAVERGPGVVGSIGQIQLFRSSFSNTAHLGILGSTGTRKSNPFLPCVAIKGFRVTSTTGSKQVEIGFYNSFSTDTVLSDGSFVSSFTMTTDNDGDFDAFFSSGGVYNITRANAGVTVPNYQILWDYLSPSCIPPHLR